MTDFLQREPIRLHESPQVPTSQCSLRGAALLKYGRAAARSLLGAATKGASTTMYSAVAATRGATYTRKKYFP